MQPFEPLSGAGCILLDLSSKLSYQDLAVKPESLDQQKILKKETHLVKTIELLI